MPTQKAEYDVSPDAQVTAGTIQDAWASVTDPVVPVTAYPDQLVLFTLPSTLISGTEETVGKTDDSPGVKTRNPRMRREPVDPMEERKASAADLVSYLSSQAGPERLSRKTCGTNSGFKARGGT